MKTSKLQDLLEDTTKAVTKMYTCILYMYTLYRDNLRSLLLKYYIFVFESKVIIIMIFYNYYNYCYNSIEQF